MRDKEVDSLQSELQERDRRILQLELLCQNLELEIHEAKYQLRGS